LIGLGLGRIGTEDLCRAALDITIKRRIMKRNFKTLGVVLAAVFAMSALGASAASAAEFHSAVAVQAVTGTQSTSHVFTTTSGTVTCKTAQFTGSTTAKTTTTQTMLPNYDNCTAFGFIGVPIHENECEYIFNVNGSTELKCPAGKSIEITVPGCTTTVGSQTFASGNTFSSNATKTDINVTTNVSGIKYKECGGAEQTGGTYKGTTTTTASSAIWYE
jgi:hypothetical protein